MMKGHRIIGFNSENTEIGEGMVRFDIVFYVRMPAADSMPPDEISSRGDPRGGVLQIIINIEAQKDEPTGYDILNRAVFYVSRLLSSQKGRDFVGTNYNDIKKVFSIWICMNMDENSIDHVHLTNDKLLGSAQWRGRLDLLNIILIGLSDELPGQEGKYTLHRLLCALLSAELSIEEKLNIIEGEYDIPAEESIREDVNVMCNLSQGILEKGIEQGIEKGEAGIIINMYYNGFTAEQIAAATSKKLEEIERIIENCQPS